MLESFIDYFDESIKLIPTGSLYNDFINQFGGKSFGNGLFRTFSNRNIVKWTEIVTQAFPEFKNPFKLVGFDWLGRCFGIAPDADQSECMYMFEIGTGDVLEIPCSLENFLNEEIPLYADACLAVSFFDEWVEISKKNISYEECAGYKVPLFLGGEDDVDNLENIDMEIYWDISTQIKNKINFTQQ